jgi:hypothetical protein
MGQRLADAKTVFMQRTARLRSRMPGNSHVRVCRRAVPVTRLSFAQMKRTRVRCLGDLGISQLRAWETSKAIKAPNGGT